MASGRLRAVTTAVPQVADGDEPGAVVPLLRLHVLSARGLPRSPGAVGMPDPYVVVKFNGEKIGRTKTDHKTRRPEWDQNFTVRWDLGEPDPPPDEDTSAADDDDELDQRCSAARSTARHPASHLPVRTGEKRVNNSTSCMCRRCRRGEIKVELEVWHQYRGGEEGTEGATSRSPTPKSTSLKTLSGAGSSSTSGASGAADSRGDGSGGAVSDPGTSKPDDLYDDRLFDVSFVSRCLQRGALRRVHTVVSGRNRLIGISSISSKQLRALGASTLPADLAIRDPRSSWLWSRRGTIRIAVSLERLQANVIGAALLPSETASGGPPGSGVGAGGVARMAAKEAMGEDLPPAELYCKVLWNDRDFSSPSGWEKVFCITRANHQLWLQVGQPEPHRPSPRPSPKRLISADKAHQQRASQASRLPVEEPPSPGEGEAARQADPERASTPLGSCVPPAFEGGADGARRGAARTRMTAGSGLLQASEELPARDNVREEGVREGHRCCVLTIGRAYVLSTFDAQGLADMLNSDDESTQHMAGTKEWHDMGFRLQWDGVRRRYTILNVARRSFVLRGGCSSLATELLGFGVEDYESCPVAEALVDPQRPSDPPRRHMGVVGGWLPPPLVRPTWMRIFWGPPAMEIAKGGELCVQLWARQPSASLSRFPQRRRRWRSGIGRPGQADDGSWLLGTALLETAEVCGIATGSPTKLPLFSPALYKHSQSKSASAEPASELAKPGPLPPEAGLASRVLRQLVTWCATTPLMIVARQRQRLRRFKRRIAGQAAVDRCLPVGTGGAYVWGGFHPRSRHWGLVRRSFGESGFGGRRAMGNGSTAAGDSQSSSLTPATKPGEESRIGVVGEEAKAVGRLFTRGDSGSSSPVSMMRQASPMHEGIVGHVWVSLKLRDPSMMMMRAVRRWNMTRDEASEEQRRMARAEAKRLWMFMPGISLWRVLVQLTGVSLLVSYCVTLTLRAYHSTSCRATFGCTEETDPMLASLREWQTLVDNLLSVLSFLDMMLQFRTAYVDSKSNIITSPRKVALHYLRTWFLPDLLCSLPYSTMQPLLQPLVDEVESSVDSLAIAPAQAPTSQEVSQGLIRGADSPLSLWVFKLSKRLRISKINRVRGTRAFKYLDDLAMGIHFSVKQAVDVVRGRRKVLVWMGKPPKRRGRLGKIFFRIGVANRWTHIVLSYRLLGYAKVIGTLVRAMRVIAVAIRAVPRAARVLRLVAVFLRSYEGRRRSKDLHEASIVIQRRAGKHLAMKVADRMRANLQRRARAVSDSAIDEISNTPTGFDAVAVPGGVASQDRRPPPLASVEFPGISIGTQAAAAVATAAKGGLSPVERSYRHRRASSSTLSLPRSQSDHALSDSGVGDSLDLVGFSPFKVRRTSSLQPRDWRSSLEPPSNDSSPRSSREGSWDLLRDQRASSEEGSPAIGGSADSSPG